jgi:hypothetical protein
VRRERKKRHSGQPASNFNPLALMIDSQVKLAGAMVRWSPLGLLLRTSDSSSRKKPI